MLLVLFALSTNAQSPIYGRGEYFGTGTSVSGFGAPSAPPQQFSGPSLFEIRQADRLVRASEAQALGDRAVYNLPLGLVPSDPFAFSGNPFGFGDFGNFAKASAAAQNEQRWQLEVRHYRATHPEMTWKDRNAIDDLKIWRDSARNQKLRRFTSIIDPAPLGNGLGSISTVFDLRSKELNHDLAYNVLSDARQDFREERSRDNKVGLRNARDDVEQTGYRRDASKFALLGNIGGSEIATLSPVFRKRASETQLEIGYRNLRAARQEYAQDPTEDNWLNVELANLFIDATEEEDQGNRSDIFVNALAQGPVQRFIGSVVSSSLNSEQESRIWLKHDRLKRQILLRQRAKAMQGGSSDSVANRMMGLASYGPTTRSSSSSDVSV